MDRLSNACDLFSLTISLKKTQVIPITARPMPPTIRINEKDLEVVNQFQYLGSTTTDSLSLDTEISKRIGKAATTLAKLTKRVWDNKHLTITIKVKVYRTCVISTLLYGSESWATYVHQDVCKRDMKACGIDTDNWEKLAENRSTWKSIVIKELSCGEGKMAEQAAVKRLQTKASQHTSVEQQNNAPVFTCLNCGRHCKSKIGLYSHNRRCTTSSSTGAIP